MSRVGIAARALALVVLVLAGDAAAAVSRPIGARRQTRGHTQQQHLQRRSSDATPQRHRRAPDASSLLETDATAAAGASVSAGAGVGVGAGAGAARADFGAIPRPRPQQPSRGAFGGALRHAKFRDGPIADYSEHAQNLESVLDPYAGVNDFDEDYGQPRDAARFASVSDAIAAAGGARAGVGVRTKEEGGNDKIECYNNHNLYQVGMLTSTAELCSLMVENLAEEFESSPAFQTECTGTFGDVCKEECRDLGHLFDQSVYANKGGHESYPADYHNRVRTYTLKYWDCKNCLEFGSCFAGTQNLLADD